MIVNPGLNATEPAIIGLRQNSTATDTQENNRFLDELDHRIIEPGTGSSLVTKLGNCI